jgi:hypothetical protein
MKPWTKDKVTKRNPIGSVSYPYVSARPNVFPALLSQDPEQPRKAGPARRFLMLRPGK